MSVSSKGSSDKSSNLKKVSNADSENYEYSDDSPEKYGISEISPFGSVSNTDFPGKSSPTLHDMSKIDLEQIKSEESAEDKYESMAQIEFSPDSVKKKENFSPVKAKARADQLDVSSPGEGKTLEYSMTVAPCEQSDLALRSENKEDGFGSLKLVKSENSVRDLSSPGSQNLKSNESSKISQSSKISKTSKTQQRKRS